MPTNEYGRQRVSVGSPKAREESRRAGAPAVAGIGLAKCGNWGSLKTSSAGTVASPGAAAPLFFGSRVTNRSVLTGGWGVARGPGFFGCVRVAATAAGCKPAVSDFAGSSPAASTNYCSERQVAELRDVLDAVAGGGMVVQIHIRAPSSAGRVGRQPQSTHPERAGSLVNSRSSRRPGALRRSGARARSQFRGKLAIARISYTRRAPSGNPRLSFQVPRASDAAAPFGARRSFLHRLIATNR